MLKDVWRCNNDEHINKNTDTECEICGGNRPIIKFFRHNLTEEFGKVNVIWEFDNAESGLLVIKKEEINLESTKGEIEIENIKNKEEITFLVNNPIATYYETLQIILEKPEISYFKSEKDRVLENALFLLSWKVKNAKDVSISNIGKVESEGKIEKKVFKSPYKIVAVNDIGKVEQYLNITVFPPPIIKEFHSNKQKIELEKETQIVWDIENAEKIELHWSGNMEVVPNKGEKNISPTEDTKYKLIVTALDGVTKEEKDITVQVFKRVEIKSFVSDLDFVIESLPVKLSWEIENSKTIVIEDSFGTQTNVSIEKSIEILAKKNIRYYKIIASDFLGNLLERKIDIIVDERPRVNINLPKIDLPKIDLSFGQKIVNKTSFDFALNEAKKKHKPIISLKKLVDYLYDR